MKESIKINYYQIIKKHLYLLLPLLWFCYGFYAMIRNLIDSTIQEGQGFKYYLRFGGYFFLMVFIIYIIPEHMYDAMGIIDINTMTMSLYLYKNEPIYLYVIRLFWLYSWNVFVNIKVFNLCERFFKNEL